jgi:hypothetical protein
MVFSRKTLCLAALGAAVLSHSPTALADSVSNFSAQFFEVANQQGAAGNNAGVTETPDFYNSATQSYPIGESPNYVTSTLGPNGLPVYNAGYSANYGTVNPLSSASLLGSTNQINWWDPASSGGNANVTSDGTGTVALSSGMTSMFAPGTTGDSNYFATDILKGYFNLTSASSVEFSIGADDTAFIYVDGTLVDSLSGLNADTPEPTSSISLSAGLHNVQIFYADRATGSGYLTFSEVSGTGLVTPTIYATAAQAVPEPSTIALFAIGILGLFAFTRRTQRAAASRA